jgi:hypothetical protein
LSGCASIFEGTTQQISVSTTPVGARCTFWRNGSLVGSIAVTPGSTTVQKTNIELFIVCDKPGYAPATHVNKPGLSAATLANILTLGLAWAVDYSRGADNKYEGQIDLALAPLGTMAPSEAPTLPPPAPPPAAAVVRPPPAPAAVVPAAAPASPQLLCGAADGSRIRVTGTACPTGWAPAR